MPDYERLRRRMVDEQLAARGIRDPDVLAAMREVPRELFVDAEVADLAYKDGPLPIAAGQTISQPYIVAAMIEAAMLQPSSRVLEIGCGSGYAAAVMSRIARRVFTIDRHAALVDTARARFEQLGYGNIEVRCADGTRGWPEAAPFDAILVAAGGPTAPASLKQQLRIGGCLVIPVGHSKSRQQLLRIRRTRADRYAEDELGEVAFVPLIGEQGWHES